jgi:hypothetical protein
LERKEGGGGGGGGGDLGVNGGPFLGTWTTHFNFSKSEPKLGTSPGTSSKTQPFYISIFFNFLTKIFLIKNFIYYYCCCCCCYYSNGLKHVVNLRKEIEYAFFWRNKF